MKKKPARNSAVNAAGSSHLQPARCAIYARFNAKPNGNDNALIHQVEACQRVAAEKGWKVEDHVYIDNGLSGNSNSMPRPGLSELLRDVSSTPKPFDVVICEGTDRLFRNLRDGLELVQKFHWEGIVVFFVDDPTGENGFKHTRLS